MIPNLRWNKEKNEKLFLERGLGFELVIEAFDVGAVIKDMDHPDPGRLGQRMLLIRVHSYVCAVPYVQDGDVKFLKTMYFSRKYDELYGGSYGQENQ